MNSRPLQQTAQEVIAGYEQTKNKYAGSNDRPLEKQSVKCSSALTAEKFKDCNNNYKYINICYKIIMFRK